jgi:hypothetical protein
METTLQLGEGWSVLCQAPTNGNHIYPRERDSIPGTTFGDVKDIKFRERHLMTRKTFTDVKNSITSIFNEENGNGGRVPNWTDWRCRRTSVWEYKLNTILEVLRKQGG